MIDRVSIGVPNTTPGAAAAPPPAAWWGRTVYFSEKIRVGGCYE